MKPSSGITTAADGAIVVELRLVAADEHSAVSVANSGPSAVSPSVSSPGPVRITRRNARGTCAQAHTRRLGERNMLSLAVFP